MSDVLDRITWHLTELGRLLADLRIEELPSVVIDSWHFSSRLPIATTAVYFMMSRGGELLYIGRATNLRSRFRAETSQFDSRYIVAHLTHAKIGPALKMGGVAVHWWAVPREMLATVESLLLQTHKPKWNNHRG